MYVGLYKTIKMPYKRTSDLGFFVQIFCNQCLRNFFMGFWGHWGWERHKKSISRDISMTSSVENEMKYFMENWIPLLSFHIFFNFFFWQSPENRPNGHKKRIILPKFLHPHQEKRLNKKNLKSGLNLKVSHACITLG